MSKGSVTPTQLIATGVIPRIKGTVATAAGAGAANGRLAKVVGLVGTVNVSSGGGTTNVFRPSIVFDD